MWQATEVETNEDLRLTRLVPCLSGASGKSVPQDHFDRSHVEKSKHEGQVAQFHQDLPCRGTRTSAYKEPCWRALRQPWKMDQKPRPEENPHSLSFLPWGKDAVRTNTRYYEVEAGKE